jgi:hypothetical protein
MVEAQALPIQGGEQLTVSCISAGKRARDNIFILFWSSNVRSRAARWTGWPYESSGRAKFPEDLPADAGRAMARCAHNEFGIKLDQDCTARACPRAWRAPHQHTTTRCKWV